MASSFSDLLRLELMATGENENTWGDKTNDNLDKLEEAVAGRTALVLASSDITLSTANGGDGAGEQAASMILDLSGTLTANVNIVAPNVSKLYLVNNQCVQTSAETVSIKTSGGSGLVVPNGETHVVWCDGNNGFFKINAEASGVVSQATNSLQLGGVVAANYARLGVKQGWSRPQYLSPTHVSLSSNAYEPDAGVDSHIVVDQSEIGVSDITINNPTGTAVDGQILIIDVEQHETTPISITFGSKFIFPDDANVDLTQEANVVDSFAFQYNNNLDRWMGKGVAQNFPRT